MASLPQLLALQIRRTVKSPGADRVHDLRVAIRRYNQALALTQNRNKTARRPLKRTMELAGEVRDLDIALKLVRKIKGAAAVLARLRERREVACAALTTFLNDRLQSSNHGFSRVKATSAAQDGNGSLMEAVHRVFKDAKKLRQAKQLHRLRIATKKLRYTLELIDPRHPRMADIKQLQSELGRINDFRTTRAMLKDDPQAQPVRDELKRKQRSKVRQFRRKWSPVFDDPPTEETWVRDFSRLRARPAMRETASRSAAQKVA